jgi:hypothetical protein
MITYAANVLTTSSCVIHGFADVVRNQRRARSDGAGAAARTHSKHCEPTAAWIRHSGQAGRPHRVQRRPVSRSGWWKQVAAVLGRSVVSGSLTLTLA